MVLPDIVLFKNSCPVCVEMKAATCQVFAGGIMPFLLGNLGCMAVCVLYFSFTSAFIYIGNYLELFTSME